MLSSLAVSLQRQTNPIVTSTIVGHSPAYSITPSQVNIIAAAITKSTCLKSLIIDLKHVSIEALRPLLRACCLSLSLQSLTIRGGLTNAHLKILVGTNSSNLNSSSFISNSLMLPSFRNDKPQQQQQHLQNNLTKIPASSSSSSSSVLMMTNSGLLSFPRILGCLFNVTLQPTSIDINQAQAIVDAVVCRNEWLRVFHLKLPHCSTPVWQQHALIWKERLRDVLDKNWKKYCPHNNNNNNNNSHGVVLPRPPSTSSNKMSENNSGCSLQKEQKVINKFVVPLSLLPTNIQNNNNCNNNVVCNKYSSYFVRYCNNMNFPKIQPDKNNNNHDDNQHEHNNNKYEEMNGNIHHHPHQNISSLSSSILLSSRYEHPKFLVSSPRDMLLSFNSNRNNENNDRRHQEQTSKNNSAIETSSSTSSSEVGTNKNINFVNEKNLVVAKRLEYSQDPMNSNNNNENIVVENNNINLANNSTAPPTRAGSENKNNNSNNDDAGDNVEHFHEMTGSEEHHRNSFPSPALEEFGLSPSFPRVDENEADSISPSFGRRCNQQQQQQRNNEIPLIVIDQNVNAIVKNNELRQLPPPSASSTLTTNFHRNFFTATRVSNNSIESNENNSNNSHDVVDATRTYISNTASTENQFVSASASSTLSKSLPRIIKSEKTSSTSSSSSSNSTSVFVPLSGSGGSSPSTIVSPSPPRYDGECVVKNERCVNNDNNNDDENENVKKNSSNHKKPSSSSSPSPRNPFLSYNFENYLNSPTKVVDQLQDKQRTKSPSLQERRNAVILSCSSSKSNSNNENDLDDDEKNNNTNNNNKLKLKKVADREATPFPFGIVDSHNDKNVLPPLPNNNNNNNIFQPREPVNSCCSRDGDNERQNQIIRNARLRTLGSKFSQIDALVIQFEAETQLVKSQIQKVITSAKKDLNLLLVENSSSHRDDGK